jgi:hypothetical protein
MTMEKRYKKLKVIGNQCSVAHLFAIGAPIRGTMFQGLRLKGV